MTIKNLVASYNINNIGSVGCRRAMTSKIYDCRPICAGLFLPGCFLFSEAVSNHRHEFPQRLTTTHSLAELTPSCCPALPRPYPSLPCPDLPCSALPLRLPCLGQSTRGVRGPWPGFGIWVRQISRPASAPAGRFIYAFVRHSDATQEKANGEGGEGRGADEKEEVKVG